MLSLKMLEKQKISYSFDWNERWKFIRENAHFLFANGAAKGPRVAAASKAKS